jgi:hypothetical protein
MVWSLVERMDENWAAWMVLKMVARKDVKMVEL